MFRMEGQKAQYQFRLSGVRKKIYRFRVWTWHFYDILAAPREKCLFGKIETHSRKKIEGAHLNDLINLLQHFETRLALRQVQLNNWQCLASQVNEVVLSFVYFKLDTIHMCSMVSFDGKKIEFFNLIWINVWDNLTILGYLNK